MMKQLKYAGIMSLALMALGSSGVVHANPFIEGGPERAPPLNIITEPPIAQIPGLPDFQAQNPIAQVPGMGIEKPIAQLPPVGEGKFKPIGKLPPEYSNNPTPVGGTFKTMEKKALAQKNAQAGFTQTAVKSITSKTGNQLQQTLGIAGKNVVTGATSGLVNKLAGGKVMGANGKLNANGLTSTIAKSGVVKNIGASLGLNGGQTNSLTKVGVGLGVAALSGNLNTKQLGKSLETTAKNAAKVAVVGAATKGINSMLGGGNLISGNGKINAGAVKDMAKNSELGKSLIGAGNDLKGKATDALKDVAGGAIKKLPDALPGIANISKNMPAIADSLKLSNANPLTKLPGASSLGGGGKTASSCGRTNHSGWETN